MAGATPRAVPRHGRPRRASHPPLDRCPSDASHAARHPTPETAAGAVPGQRGAVRVTRATSRAVPGRARPQRARHPARWANGVSP